MTLYWRLSGIVQRMIPHRWMRAWALEHVESLHLRIVEPALDLTIVPHREVQIVLNGETLHLRLGDTVNVEIVDTKPPICRAPASMAVH